MAALKDCANTLTNLNVIKYTLGVPFQHTSGIN